MGNKLGGRRQVVDEKYTKPQGLYQHKDVDHKKLKKLILDSKLAPCYPGDEDSVCDREECPICFLYYPSLNRSRCCMKGICTECFLQMKTPNSARPTQCPFCKTSNYAVEYRGMKTKEEIGIEQMEEQRVIEAKIRMQQKELQDEEERMLRRQETSSSSSIIALGEVEDLPVAEGEEIVSSQYSSAASSTRQPLRSRQNRDDEFDLDLEDIMVMEAIWLSIQENDRYRNPPYCEGGPSEHEQFLTDPRCLSAAGTHLAESSSSPSGGLACAIAALAERQQTGGESSSNYTVNTSSSNMLPSFSGFANRDDQVTQNYSPSVSSVEVSPEIGVAGYDGEWVAHHGSEVAEVGPSYGSSDGVGELPPHDEIEGDFQTVAGPIVPESFEEQMMLAMAVSLAEARARTSPPGVAWH